MQEKEKYKTHRSRINHKATQIKNNTGITNVCVWWGWERGGGGGGVVVVVVGRKSSLTVN